jgi:hypothetical protein
LTPPMFLPRHVPPLGPWWVVVACLARGCNALALQSGISPSTAWIGHGRRSLGCFALHLLLRWVRQPAGVPNTFIDRTQPNQRRRRVILNRHGDSQRRGSQRWRCRLPHQQRVCGSGSRQRDSRCRS